MLLVSLRAAVIAVLWVLNLSSGLRRTDCRILAVKRWAISCVADSGGQCLCMSGHDGKANETVLRGCHKLCFIAGLCCLCRLSSERELLFSRRLKSRFYWVSSMDIFSGPLRNNPVVSCYRPRDRLLMREDFSRRAVLTTQTLERSLSWHCTRWIVLFGFLQKIVIHLALFGEVFW